MGEAISNGVTKNMEEEAISNDELEAAQSPRKKDKKAIVVLEQNDPKEVKGKRGRPPGKAVKKKKENTPEVEMEASSDEEDLPGNKKQRMTVKKKKEGTYSIYVEVSSSEEEEVDGYLGVPEHPDEEWSNASS